MDNKQRYRFVRDNDGHWYLIRSQDYDNFYLWVEEMESNSENRTITDFEECRVDGISKYTFALPKED